MGAGHGARAIRPDAHIVAVRMRHDVADEHVEPHRRVVVDILRVTRAPGGPSKTSPVPKNA